MIRKVRKLINFVLKKNSVIGKLYFNELTSIGKDKLYINKFKNKQR